MHSDIKNIPLEKIKSHLSMDEKQAVFEKLVSIINKGNERISELKDHFTSIESGHSDPVDKAEEANDREQTLREIDREKTQIKHAMQVINYSIQYLEYGYCLNDDCGEEIPFARLNAFPLTLLCLDCKADEELQQKHASNFSLASLG